MSTETKDPPDRSEQSSNSGAKKKQRAVADGREQGIPHDGDEDHARHKHDVSIGTRRLWRVRGGEGGRRRRGETAEKVERGENKSVSATPML